MTEPTSTAARPVVAVAVVTSSLGILVGRRRDGNPPWTFPAGKIEPRESPEDAAVREAFEETGLRVRATGVVGSRVHPLTGALMVYVAAVPTAETCDAADSGRELAEVRWVSPVEAGELMGEMADFVRDYLDRELG